MSSAVNTRRGHRPSQGFMEKTLSGISGALEQSLFADEIARQPGLLQRLDPRAKLLASLALLIAAALARNLVVLAALGLFGLLLAAFAGIPLRYFFKRVWIAVLLFTGVIVLPSLFSPFTPGPALVTLIDTASPRAYLAITVPGVMGAVTLLLRVGASVSIAVLLVLTTRWSALLKALQILRVPQAFILILGMTYRYIYMLLHTANNMFLARRSRLVGRVSGDEDRRWLSASVGSLLSRSYDMSEEVYLAMQSRGYRGEAQIMDSLRWRAQDTAALLAAAAIAALVIWFGR